MKFVLISVFSFLMVSQVFANPLVVDDVVGFEVLSIGPCKNGFQCAFGHSLIRVNLKNSALSEDPVLGFTTDAAEPQSFSQKLSFAVKSVSGLPLVYSVFNLKTAILNYSWNEKRKITRIPLQVNKKNKALLVKNINDVFYNSGPKKSSDQTAYDSLINNCAGEIVDLLADSGFSSELFGIALPSNLPAHLYRTYNALYPGLETSIDSSLEKSYSTLPESFYQFCEDMECAEDVVKNFNTYWPKAQIDFPVFKNSNLHSGAANLKIRSEPVHWNNMKPVVQKHFELISKAMETNN